MRKLLSVLSSTLQGGVRGGLLFVALLATTTLWAQDSQIGVIFQVGDLDYKITNDTLVPYTVEVTQQQWSNNYVGLTTATIPETVTYTYYDAFKQQEIEIICSVTSIGRSAFANCSSLTSVAIPNSVTTIGESAFANCSSLTSVAIPNSVTTIGESALSNCSSLASITIPNSVTSIGGWAFSGCSMLTSMVVESGNTIYDSRENCNAIIETETNILISGCKNTIIPNNVASIGQGAFYRCYPLISITIPNSVTSIGDNAFSHCSSLTSITIPNSVTSIGDQVFYECTSLPSITIPNSVTSIGAAAFAYCYSLTSITIPNSVTSSIEYEAFYGCSSLTSVTIGNGVTSIGAHSFQGCVSLSSIAIGNSVTTIGHEAFCSCQSLTSVTIPNSVTNIGDDAFEGCVSLTSITIHDGLKTIEPTAFAFCYSLTSITFPNTLTSIGGAAFYGCSSLASVTIPSSVTSIGSGAFYACYELDKVTCLAMVPPAIGEDAFYECDNPTLLVPCKALPNYQAHEQWGLFENIECIASEEVATEDVVITTGTTDVTITWPTDDNADTYTIVIQKSDDVFCTLIFNAEGQLLNVASAQSRDGNRNHSLGAQYAEQAVNGYRFTVTGLTEATRYAYNITTKDADNNTIATYFGEFTTLGGIETAVEDIVQKASNCQKVIRNGQLLILRDDKTYNIVGQIIE